jgi:hypothetical protein
VCHFLSVSESRSAEKQDGNMARISHYSKLKNFLEESKG